MLNTEKSLASAHLLHYQCQVLTDTLALLIIANRCPLNTLMVTIFSYNTPHKNNKWPAE